jgi:hypothetical protein
VVLVDLQCRAFCHPIACVNYQSPSCKIFHASGTKPFGLRRNTTVILPLLLKIALCAGHLFCSANAISPG